MCTELNSLTSPILSGYAVISRPRIWLQPRSPCRIRARALSSRAPRVNEAGGAGSESGMQPRKLPLDRCVALSGE
ncbi:hypothetical protein VTO73DRAFT_10378 [Trametes versicolor]